MGIIASVCSLHSYRLNLKFELRPSWNNIHDTFPTRTAQDTTFSSYTLNNSNKKIDDQMNFEQICLCLTTLLSSKAEGTTKCAHETVVPSGAHSIIYNTRIGTLIVATIYLQLIQNRHMFRSFTVLQCSHQHCVQPVASDVEVVGYL